MNTRYEKWLCSRSPSKRDNLGRVFLVALHLVFISKCLVAGSEADLLGEDSIPSEISEINGNDGNVEVTHVLNNNQDPWADLRDKKNMFLRSTRALYEDPVGENHDLLKTTLGLNRIYGKRHASLQMEQAMKRLLSEIWFNPEGSLSNRVLRSDSVIPETKRHIGDGMWTRSLRSPANQDMLMRSLKRSDDRDMYMRSLRSIDLSQMEARRFTRGNDMLTRSLRSDNRALNDMLARSLKKRQSSANHMISQRGNEMLTRSLRSNGPIMIHSNYNEEERLNRALRSKNTREERGADSFDMLIRSLRSIPLEKTLKFNDWSSLPMPTSIIENDASLRRKWDVAQAKVGEHPRELAKLYLRLWEGQSIPRGNRTMDLLQSKPNSTFG